MGKDSHVDDFVIDRVLPETDACHGRQVALVCGPNIIDQNGNIIWKKDEDGVNYDHVQKIIVADLFPDKPGKEVYVAESYRRRSHLFTCHGEPLWTYDNYTCLCDDVPFGRLTTAGALVNWSGKGKIEFAQPEYSGFPVTRVRGCYKTNCSLEELARHEECWLRFMHIIDRYGQPVDIFPITCVPMCAIAAKVTGAATDDIVMVGHHDSRIHIYTRR